MKRALVSAIVSCVVLISAAVLCSPRLIAAGKSEVIATAPLGMESLLPRPHGQAFAIYASAEGVDLNWLQTNSEKLSSTNARVSPAFFPAPLSFRVTATTLGITPADAAPAAFDSDVDTAKLLASLQFRLRVSPGGLRTERLDPADVRMIGVPADVPYGERIYRVTFQSGPLPITHRLVLEVIAPNGELLCKFPLAVN